MTDKKQKPKKPLFRAEPRNNKFSWQVQFTLQKPKFLINSQGPNYENCGLIQKLFFKANFVLLSVAKPITQRLEGVAKRASEVNEQKKEKATSEEAKA